MRTMQAELNIGAYIKKLVFPLPLRVRVFVGTIQDKITVNRDTRTHTYTRVRAPARMYICTL